MLVAGVLLSGIIYVWVIATTQQGILQIVRLQQVYSLIAMAYLYLTLLAGPFCYTFRWFPYREEYLKARRALGVCAFYFGSLQALLVFFGFLGGFNGVAFLSTSYLIALGMGVIAFGIMFLLTITSTDYMVAKLTFPRWKLLHRFVYLAAALIFADALMLAPYFRDLTDPVGQITFFALAFLLLLEAPRIDKLLGKFIKIPTFGLSFVILSVVLAVIFFTVINPLFTAGNGTISFDIHGAHKQLAQQALQQSQQNPLGNNFNLNNIPAFVGDRTKRFSVSFLHPQTVNPNEDAKLQFQVDDASSGNPVLFFKTVYEKPMHLVIVDDKLEYFSHIHPIQIDNSFVTATQFPHSGVYHLYINFQPFGAIEQQSGFTLDVGATVQPKTANQPVDTNLSKVFGTYLVNLKAPKPLVASKISIGEAQITFSLEDAKTNQPIKNLKPYLAAFGHLVMINQETYDYIHVHPSNLTAPKPNENGGPDVTFLPLGLYGPIKPGIYRVFAQFNPDGNLFTAEYTIKIE